MSYLNNIYRKRWFKLTLIIIIILLAMSFIGMAIINILFDRKGSEVANTALIKMKAIPYYSKLHNISKVTRNKVSEIFLERGNYEWGGYDAILIIETNNEVTLYSYLRYDDGYRYSTSVIDKRVYHDFLDNLIKIGLMHVTNRYYTITDSKVVYDGSTYFLFYKKDGYEKNIIVYSPEILEGAKKHHDIIRQIITFGRTHSS